MLVHQKEVQYPHNKAEAKKGICWPVISGQYFFTQSLVFFANICHMSDYQNVLALKVVRNPPKKKWCGNQVKLR
jgi:hypothetical protein